MKRTRRDRVRRGAVVASLGVSTIVGSCADRPDPDSRQAGLPGPAAELVSWPHERIDARCRLPSDPVEVREEGGAVLVVWEMPAEDVYGAPVLPADPGLLAWRAALRADSANLLRPVGDEPEPATEEEAALREDERFNGELALQGEVGEIAPITCLDALLFAYQNARVSQLERPTEFLASVLRRDAADGPRLAVVFGAGSEMYPPKWVYGFDVVDAYRDAGWRWLYVLHNHTTQPNGERLVLGTPTLSTSDVQLTRGLAAERGLEGARVTNGFLTFSAPYGDLRRLRSR